MHNNDDTKTSPVNKLPASLDEPLKQIIDKEGYIKYEVNTQSVPSKNSNHLGCLYTIDVKGTTKDGDKETNLFVKCLEPDIKSLDIFPITNVYKIELFVYKELFKIFDEIQDDANVPLEERYKTVKFYEESTTEAIIMENMAKTGYTTYNRMDAVCLQLAKLAVQELAKFHGLSFVLKVKRPEYFEKKIKSIKVFIDFEADWKGFVEFIKNKTMPFVDEEYKHRVEKEYDILVDKFPKYLIKQTTSAGLCHGDYKLSNMLLNIKNGNIHEILNLDYQLVFYACPIFDFLLFIYYSTDREFRNAHLTDLKDLYYETLSTFMKKLDVDPESVYPRKEFEEAYLENKDYGLAISLLFLIFLFVPEEGKSDMLGLNLKTDDRFKDRIRGVIEDYVEWGYL